ncbi:DNA replication complex GINS family protein [Candidatus Bathyarchaeota archaeon]|nr:DNA replication complex GINS family protein [Candidatus Bathyarchaeota archaeon]
MHIDVSRMIKAIDFAYENLLVKVIANRNCPEIKLGGLKVGPFEEGNQYEVYYWVARELEKFGIIRFPSETFLDASKLYKIHWKERIQPFGQVSQLPENFYPQLRRYMANLRKEASKNPEKMIEYKKAKNIAMDILTLRMKKLVSAASAQTSTREFLKNFTEEEKVLYEKVSALIRQWRDKMLECEAETE